MFLWLWNVLQWNIMGRCINVEPLPLHNLKVFEDHIQILYDSKKMDQTGDKVTMKNIYANPLNPRICTFLALGTYLAMNSPRFTKTEHLWK